MKRFFAIYKEYLKLIKPYKALFIFSWFGLVALLFAYNASIFVVGNLIDTISADHQSVIPSLLIITGILSLPLLLEPILFFTKTRLFSAVASDIVKKAFKRVMTLDHAFHTSKQTGKITAMILNAEDTINVFLWGTEWILIENLAAFLIPIFFITVIKPELGLLLLCLMIVSLPAFKKVLSINIKTRNTVKEISYERTDLIVDNLSNYETVRIFSREGEEVGNMEKVVNKWKVAVNRYQDSFRIIDFVARVVGVTVFVATAGLAYKYFDSKALSLGSFIVVITYLIQLVGRFINVVFSMRDILKHLPIAKDLFKLINEENTILEDSTPVIPKSENGEVKFNNVTFQYEKGKKILDQLSLTALPKQNIALVGPSGGGKSTCIKLLMRYYDTLKGSITLDGVDIKKLPLKYLKESIGLVPQEPSLFNKSILYNIGYALCSDPEKIEDYREEIIEASKRACVYDFIQSLPNKFDTIVGERGVKLSGGQKQRIAIARVLLKMPKIVIFDEATSMLDSESEQAIKTAFAELSKDKTTIVIAHRLSTIINCDKIFVIEDGKVAESGTHTQLIKKNGLYSRLWNIQSGGFQNYKKN